MSWTMPLVLEPDRAEIAWRADNLVPTIRAKSGGKTLHLAVGPRTAKTLVTACRARVHSHAVKRNPWHLLTCYVCRGVLEYRTLVGPALDTVLMDLRADEHPQTVLMAQRCGETFGRQDLLVLADWLDERGDQRGEFLRAQVELAMYGRSMPLGRFADLLARRWLTAGVVTEIYRRSA